MKKIYFDVLTISQENLDKVDMIQAMLANDCLGAFLHDESAELYFNCGSKEKIEIKLDRLINSQSKNWIWKKQKSENWHLAWQDHFKPIVISKKLKIIPYWYENQSSGFVIKIKPGMAFGTGHHETTWLMLNQMMKEIKEGMKVLDLGTGSGILAITAKKIGAKTVDAVDNDLECKSNFFENMKLNKIITGVNFFHKDALIWDTLDYDLIIANINQKIIEQLVPKFQSTNARIILSGILAKNSSTIEKLLYEINFIISDYIIKGDWLCISAQKS